MTDGNDSHWKLLLAAFVAIGTTAGISALVTSQWIEGDTADGVTGELSPEPSGDPPTDASDAPDVYDLPDHCGRLVASDEGDRFGLPRSTADYEVDIQGDLATIVVRQHFENTTDMTLSPVYEFPLYSEAAVYDMVMEVGGRTIEATVKRKKEARETYEEAKAAGKKAALLSQDRPNLFTQRVANVEPGQTVAITLRYTHPVPKDEGLYRLAIPLAVPDRYTPDDMSDNKLVDGESNDPGTKPGGSSKGDEGFDEVDLEIRLDGGMPVSAVQSPSHRMRVERYSEAVRRIELAPDGDPTDRHFRLAYRLSGDETRVGTHSYWEPSREDDAEQGPSGTGYFSLMLEPPADVAAEQLPDREMVFVLDRSGSMEGKRFEAARAFVLQALQHLRPDDRFRIVLFNDSVQTFRTETTPATPEHVESASKWLQQRHAEDGTEIAPGLRAALEPEPSEGRMRLVTLVTDAKVSNEFEVIELVRRHIDRARLFTLGMGGDVNRYLLEELGRAGRGFSEQFQLGQHRGEFIDDAVRRIQTPVLTDVSIDWGGLEPTHVTPRPIPDVFEGGAVRIHGRYDIPARHTITVEGQLGGEPVTFERTVEFADSAGDGEAVKLAWARQRIDDSMLALNTPEELRRESKGDEALKERITRLGLDYSLTTQWTSFVAVDQDAKMARSLSRDGTELKAGRGAKRQRKSAKDVKKKTIIETLGSNAGADKGGLGRSGSASDPGSGKAAGIGDLGQTEGAKQAKSGTSTGAQKKESQENASITLEEPNVSKGLKVRRIRIVVTRYKARIERCYERELKTHPKLEGRAVVAFTIGRKGRVSQASPETSEFTRSIERLQSPESPEATEVTAPIAFEAK